MFLARNPRAELCGVVEILWYAEGATTEATREWVLPFGRGQLLINLASDSLRWYRRNGEITSLSSIALAGPFSTALLVDTADQERVVGVSLTEFGTAWLARSAAVVSNQIVSIDDLDLGHGHLEAILRVAETARASDDPQSILDQVEDALCLTSRLPTLGPTLRASIAELESSDTIATIARRLGRSRRGFSREFRESVGLKPKLFQRLRRFRRALSALEQCESIASLAASLGYADQSHFNHDFREFSGVTPTHYIANRTGYIGHIRAPQ